MKWSMIMFVFVPILNIALNTLTAKTAKISGDFLSTLTTVTFLSTILVGTSSVICLVALYRSGIPLPKGILLMGAMSILLGSLWGMWYTGVKFNAIEWSLFVAIALFMAARFFQFLK